MANAFQGYQFDLLTVVTAVMRRGPSAVILEDGRVVGVEFQPTGNSDAGEKFVIPADMVLKAIGQGSHFERAESAGSFEAVSGRLVVDQERRTSCSGIWAGGDCIAGGDVFGV